MSEPRRYFNALRNSVNCEAITVDLGGTDDQVSADIPRAARASSSAKRRSVR